MVEAVQKFKEENMEDANDALFFVLKENLKSEERKLFENIENLHELYVTNIYDVDDQLDPKKISVTLSTALKADANMWIHLGTIITTEICVITGFSQFHGKCGTVRRLLLNLVV